MAKPSNKTGNFNPTVTVMFQTYSGNFMTRDLDEERVREIKEAVNSLKVGEVLFLKKSKTPNSSGKYSYFLEIANPANFTKKSGESDSI